MKTITATALNPVREEYVRAGYLTEELVWAPPAGVARQHPEQVAVVDGDQSITYGELWSRIESLAASLVELGVAPATAVIYQVPNWWENVVTHYAIARAGAVAVPLMPIYREHELGFVIAEVRPSLVVSGGEFGGEDLTAAMLRALEKVGHACPVIEARPSATSAGQHQLSMLARREVGAWLDGIETKPTDICAVIYTSGSTGVPKGVLHTHQTLLYDARTRVTDFGLTGDDVILMPSPLAHIGGMSYGVHLPAILGCSTVLMERWSPRLAADLIEARGATIMNGAPVMLHGLSEVYRERQQRTHLRIFAGGGGDLSESLMTRAKDILGCFVTRAYGCSEIPTVSWGKMSDDPGRVLATDGRAIGPVGLRVVDDQGVVLGPDQVGECEAMGPERCVGYVDEGHNAALFTSDGWVKTGDLVSIDRDGYLSVRGRKKDIVVRGGENISAQEVERLIAEFDGVSAVAVVAMPDPNLGELVCAFAEVVAGVSVTLDDVRAWLRSQGVAKVKWPEELVTVEQLPRIGFGKVNKTDLRQRATVLARDRAGAQPRQAPRQADGTPAGPAAVQERRPELRYGS